MLVVRGSSQKRRLPMLVLSRRLRERICFPDINAFVQVVAIKPNLVRLGIEAPPDLTILREELQGLAVVGQPPDPGAGVRNGAGKAVGLDPVLQVVSAGIEEARLQLRAGRVQDGELLLAKIQHDLERLRQGPDRRAKPRPPAARRRRASPARQRLPV